MQEKHWRRANTILLTLIVIINGYVIAAPFLPNLLYWWESNHSSKQSQLAKQLSTPVQAESAATAANELIIPKMLLETPLVEGPMSDSFSLLNKGAWHLPISSNPEKGGNMVVAGHRFSYTGPRGIFYYLNKLAPGDEIGVRWEGKMYRYTVQSARTVASTEVSIQEPTTDTRLTLYTCTPLWNPVNRLVVVAVPKETT